MSRIIGLLIFPLLHWGDPAEKAHLIIYRERELFSNSYTLKINQQVVADFPARSYLDLQLSSGPIEIESVGYRANRRVLKLVLAPGQTYYVKAYEEVDFMDRKLRLQVVSPATAAAEMTRLRRLEKYQQPD